MNDSKFENRFSFMQKPIKPRYSWLKLAETIFSSIFNSKFSQFYLKVNAYACAFWCCAKSFSENAQIIKYFKRKGAAVIDTREDKYFIFIQPRPRKSADCFPLQTNEKEILIAFQVFTHEIFRFFNVLFFWWGGGGIF